MARRDICINRKGFILVFVNPYNHGLCLPRTIFFYDNRDNKDNRQNGLYLILYVMHNLVGVEVESLPGEAGEEVSGGERGGIGGDADDVRQNTQQLFGRVTPAKHRHVKTLVPL